MDRKQRLITTDGFSRAPVYKRRSISDYSYKRQNVIQQPIANKQVVNTGLQHNNHFRDVTNLSTKNNILCKTNLNEHSGKTAQKNSPKLLSNGHKKINVPDFPIPKHNKFSLKRFKKNKTTYALLATALLLLIAGAYVNISSFLTNKKLGETVVAGQYTSADSDSQEEGRPSTNSSISEVIPTNTAIKEYRVAPDLPKLLRIDSLGTWSRVKRVGVDEKNEIGNPKNVFDTAWYDGSAKPGEPGAVFINGHVLGPTKGGVFANLKNIKTGAIIRITKGDNTIFEYKVVAKEQYDANSVDMGKVLRPYNNMPEGLNIMTCTGKYNRDEETFNKRLVVYAIRSN